MTLNLPTQFADPAPLTCVCLLSPLQADCILLVAPEGATPELGIMETSLVFNAAPQQPPPPSGSTAASMTLYHPSPVVSEGTSSSDMASVRQPPFTTWVNFDGLTGSPGWSEKVRDGTSSIGGYYVANADPTRKSLDVKDVLLKGEATVGEGSVHGSSLYHQGSLPLGKTQGASPSRKGSLPTPLSSLSPFHQQHTLSRLQTSARQQGSAGIRSGEESSSQPQQQPQLLPPLPQQLPVPPPPAQQPGAFSAFLAPGGLLQPGWDLLTMLQGKLRMPNTSKNPTAATAEPAPPTPISTPLASAFDSTVISNVGESTPGMGPTSGIGSHPGPRQGPEHNGTTHRPSPAQLRRVELVLLHSATSAPLGTEEWLNRRPHLTRHHHVRLENNGDISR